MKSILDCHFTFKKYALSVIEGHMKLPFHSPTLAPDIITIAGISICFDSALSNISPNASQKVTLISDLAKIN